MHKKIFTILLLISLSWTFGENLTYLKNFIDTFSRIKTLKVNFIQIYLSSITEEKESGVMYYKKPLNFRWEYKKPEEKIFLLLKDKTYFYIPDENQVIISKIGKKEVENSLIKVFTAKSLKDIKKKFKIIPAGITKEIFSYLLIPKNENNFELKNLSLKIDLKSHLPTEVSIRNGREEENIFKFKGYKINLKIDKTLFKMKLSSDVEKIFEE